MTKDKGGKTPDRRNPPKSGKAGSGPGRSVAKNHRPQGPDPEGPRKSPTQYPGPHTKGNKPPPERGSD